MRMPDRAESIHTEPGKTPIAQSITINADKALALLRSPQLSNQETNEG